MKKTVLLSLVVLVAGIANAQTTMQQWVKSRHFATQSLNTKLPLKTGAEQLTFPASQPAQVRTDGIALGSVVIGTTVYDLETNSAIARRILLHEGGAVTAVWTMAQLNTFADRGTGYAYFDGSTWTVQNPTSTLEPLKTGWPTIQILNGKEFDISHDGTNYLLQQGVSNGVGLGTSSDWTFDLSGASGPVDISLGSHGSIWPRMVVNGNTIHVVSSFQIIDTLNDIINGVKAPFVYSRSTDGGATWTPNIGLPGYDSTRTLFGGGDEYDIDNNGSTIAIVHGGLGEDVSMWKSTDDGASWTHTYVDSFPYAPDYTLLAPVGLNVPTNDGSVSVVVDDNNTVHVAYAGSVVIHDTTFAGGGAFSPGTIDLRYWTEGMDTAVSVPLPVSAFDVDGDGNYVIGSNTTNLGSASDPGCRYRNNSILTFPSISYDANGDIFILFSMPRDLDTTSDGLTYRDVYVAEHKVEDDLTLWSIENVTNTDFTEEVFACAARKSDDKIRIEYMEDGDPGTNLNNGRPIGSNNINYIEWQNPFITGINPVSSTPNFSIKQNYPNPFTDQTQIQLTTNKASAVNVKVTSLLGENVWENNFNYSAGTHNITINRASLSSGIYFYTVKCGNESLTRKMIIE